MQERRSDTLTVSNGEINLFIMQEMQHWQRALSPAEKKAITEVALGNSEKSLSLLNYLSDDGKTMCIKASAAFGHLTLLKSLIKHCPTTFSILLELAAEKGQHDVVNYLLSHRYKVDPHQALCLAAANGHLKVVNCLVRDHKVDPNNGKAYAPPRFTKKSMPVLRRSDALYHAAAAGHMDVVLSLLDDPRTSYFGSDDIHNKSPNEKAFIIAQTTVNHVLMNESIDSEKKREILFGVSRQLLMRNQHRESALIFDGIAQIIKTKLVYSCFGKKAPNEMIDKEIVEMFYGSYHTEIHLLVKSSLFVLPDGKIKFVYDKSSKIYKDHYSPEAIKAKKEAGYEASDLTAEMTSLAHTLGYEIVSDADSLIFNLESSLELKAMCIHYRDSYVLALSQIQTYWKSYINNASWMHMVTKDVFELQMIGDIWNHIANYYIKLMTDLEFTSYIDQTDKRYIFNTKFVIPSPTHFLLPPDNDSEPQVVEIPMFEEDNFDSQSDERSSNKIEIFKTIYKALYEGQSSLFKHWNGELMDGAINDATEITNYISSHKVSRTAIAWELTIKFVNGEIENKELFKEIHEYAYKNSSSLGFFKKSVLTDSYTELEQRINKAKSGNELEGTRTKAIVDVLNTNSSFKL
ncbi:MAG: ankyrin repeat domain-containing protein [Tatlockia sp.]|nr:ankyrin repeat domain-containing protein [Tatlockia sp.]